MHLIRNDLIAILSADYLGETSRKPCNFTSDIYRIAADDKYAMRERSLRHPVEQLNLDVEYVLARLRRLAGRNQLHSVRELQKSSEPQDREWLKDILRGDAHLLDTLKQQHVIDDQKYQAISGGMDSVRGKPHTDPVNKPWWSW